MLIDLTGVFRRAHGASRLRDEPRDLLGRLGCAVGVGDVPRRRRGCGCRARGSAVPRLFGDDVSRAASAPETPDLRPLAGIAQRWRDLEGYYTRFGDVRELLDGVDDRYVIMNAGDELRLRFPGAAAAARRAGARDFVADRRRLGEGRRLQHRVLADGAAAADARPARLRTTPPRDARGRSGLPAASRGLGASIIPAT